MPRHALVIAIDGLRASALGAYGNTLHPTPALDSLASRSIVFDWAFCNGPLLEDFYSSAWGQIHDLLPARLKQSGVFAKLMTDDQEVAKHAEEAAFQEVEQIAFDADKSAASIPETQLALFFAAALDELESWPAEADDPARLLWLHSRGLRGPWDAPLELRAQLLDENDPPAPTFFTPPSSVATMDHDELLLHRAAYAAQIIVLDECLGVLAETLDSSRLARDLAVILIGARGYALGEHGCIGSDARSLYGELLHIPLLIHKPGDEAPPPRSPNLMQPSDLLAMLTNWFETGSLDWNESEVAARQLITASGRHGERMIRTQAWALRQGAAVSQPSCDSGPPSSLELYAKPDDRWEANEIADRCPDVAERLLAILDAATCGNHAAAAIPPLDDDLIHPAR